MSYEDLSRQVNAALRTEGNTLFEFMRRNHPELDEHTWVDQVSRNLAQGRFLFIVAGDGIHEGVVAITEQLHAALGSASTSAWSKSRCSRSTPTMLSFSRGLLARTVTVERSVVRIEEGVAARAAVLDADEDASERAERTSDPALVAVRRKFWDRFVATVKLEGGLDSGRAGFSRTRRRPAFPSGSGSRRIGARAWRVLACGFRRAGTRRPRSADAWGSSAPRSRRRSACRSSGKRPTTGSY